MGLTVRHSLINYSVKNGINLTYYELSALETKTLWPSGQHINPTALRKAKIANNFGLSECNRVKGQVYLG